MATEVTVHEAKTHLSKLLDRALAGEEVVIMRSGKKLVKLTPVEGARSGRRVGSAKGDFLVPDDFDTPLPEDVIAGFEK